MIIKGILKEELSNSLQARRAYERSLAALPKGCLVRKIIGGHAYYYLAFREKGRVRFAYKGKLSREDVRKHEAARRSRARYRRHLSDIKEQIRFLRKALRGQKPA